MNPSTNVSLFTKLLAFVCFIFIKLLTRTLRYTYKNRQYTIKAEKDREPVLHAVWHGRQIVLLGYPYHLPMVQMCSLSHDGELIARILRLLRFSVVRGSSSRRGREASFEMTEMVLGGSWGALAVDGSRGPLGKVNPGILFIARDTGARIIPLVASAKWKIEFKRSWDRFMLPLPFSKAVVIEGKPLEIDHQISDRDLEEVRLQLEKQMFTLHKQADEFWKKN